MMAAVKISAQEWLNRAARVEHDARPFVSGTRVDPCTEAVFENIDPASGVSQGQIPDCAAEDVDHAVAAARSAFDRGEWRRTPPASKKQILSSFAELIRAHACELALLDTLDMGKPVSHSLGSVLASADHLDFYAESLDKLRSDMFVTDEDVHAYQLLCPRGVVAAIVAWNFPVLNAVVKIGPSLATGNSLVLKPSEISPRSALRLAELAIEAGVPAGVFNVVPGTGSRAGQALARHPSVDMITFIGSTTTGGRLMQYAGQSNLTPVLLECGGKSPSIVFPDVDDLDAEADRIAARISFNQGQVCVAGSRLLVHGNIAEPLISRVVDRLAAINPTVPLDPDSTYGPMAFEAQRDKVLSYIEKGVISGATVALRGGVPRGFEAGFYVTPAVFCDVRLDSDLTQDEIFGPVLTATTFRDIDEAIRIANSTRYGLCANVSTRDARTIHRMARALNVGVVRINATPRASAQTVFSASHEPVGASGVGVDLGLEGMLSYLQRRSIAVDFT